ncbi:GDP-L-fucose synthase [Jezberella montanilacus]|uniref:GDP-L-fucose synthase n=1 Tax=Jezberella montanilacus TaxID=323426 RepID=A0A2T0XIC3_9BURK|nr:NAD-dependent epimerase/dehydratase family protein [Jezberella montanilacus]PRY98665.1 GDP-L-fucose synthase [Jezberella montanilacus]
MARLLILGANGFIGKNLKEFFLKTTDYDVLAPTRHELNLLDDAACTDYLGAHLPEFVIHCAVDITSVEKTLAMFFNIYNQKASFGQLITLGSGAEYDKRCYTPNMTEERLGISVPIDTYGLAKYLIAREIENGRNSNVLNLRVFGIFGPHEDINRRFISNNICRVLCGLPISVNRDMLFNYIYVDDLAKAIALILPKLPLHSKSYNFCRSASDSLLDIAELIHRKLSVESEVIVRTPGRNPEYSGCPDKYFKEVGHVQFEPMDVSIDKLIKYYTQCMGSGELKALREKWK